MKKILMLAGIFCLPLFLHAQDASTTTETKTTQFGIKTGFNAAILSATVNGEASWKLGLHAGMYVRTPIGKNFYFRPEIYFSSQGQKTKWDADDGTTTLKLNYVNVPLLFEVGKKVSFQFGPQLGILLSAKEKGTLNGDHVNVDVKDTFRSTDISVVLGIGFNPVEHLNFGLRGNIGMSNIISSDYADDAPAVKNRAFHLYIGYSF